VLIKYILLLIVLLVDSKPHGHLAQTTEHPPIVCQAEPRVDVHVDLYVISRDLQAIKSEIARRPTRREVLKLALGCVVAVVAALLLVR
jgi:hypothetical protein